MSYTDQTLYAAPHQLDNGMLAQSSLSIGTPVVGQLETVALFTGSWPSGIAVLARRLQGKSIKSAVIA
jgi:hypothetical protein